jgi:hypothetical protein
MFLGDQFKFLKSIALKNTKGTIKAFDKWDGSGAYIDIIPDIKQSFAYLNNVPYIIMMSPKTYSDFVLHISFDNLYKIGALFGCAPNDRSWLSVCNEYEDDCVLVVAKSQYCDPECVPVLKEKLDLLDLSVVLIDIR